jgi:transposase-like protein
MTSISYRGYRFPRDIIQHGVWLYLRFAPSFRDVEDLLAERGIVVSYETIRRWVAHFGPLLSHDSVAVPQQRDKAASTSAVRHRPLAEISGRDIQPLEES